VTSLGEIVGYCDRYLRLAEISDYPNAVNGLQLENSGSVSRIAAAVDASAHAIQAAVEKHANFLIVHHGMFWQGVRAVTGAFHRKLKLALEHDIAIYSVHLPLDLHPDVGNNTLLMRALGIGNARPFFEEKGSLLGRRATVDVERDDIVARLESALNGPVKTILAGPARTKEVAVITGGAGDEVERVVTEGIDTFITGEAPHFAAIAAEELGLNLLLGGHYATETFGVKALAAHLADKFQLSWEFIDLPSGL
jgi:dinuclear metal center YbgI/SA1388 family protein